MHIAAEIGNTQMIQFLLSKGANPNVVSLIDDTPLYLAADRNQLEAVKLVKKSRRLEIFSH